MVRLWEQRKDLIDQLTLNRSKNTLEELNNPIIIQFCSNYNNFKLIKLKKYFELI